MIVISGRFQRENACRTNVGSNVYLECSVPSVKYFTRFKKGTVEREYNDS